MADAAERDDLVKKINEVKLIRIGARSESVSDFSESVSAGTSSRFSFGVTEDEETSWPSTRLKTGISEIDMMKERFAKLLLREDMSGSGKGVSTALAISNAITNLYASVFGQLWRLEPLPIEKKGMWRKEMAWLLSVSDHIVEMVPSHKTFPDGTKLEIMTSRQRSDLFANLPALRKLESLLMEILDGFSVSEFWYVDRGKAVLNTDSFRKAIQRQEEKWWLPVPRIPVGGLSTDSRKQLLRKRDFANQVLKAAMTINTNAISEMEVPESYFETLPKSGRAWLGHYLYKLISSDQFSTESLFERLQLSDEHVVLEVVNRLEAAISIWHRRNLSSDSTRTKSILLETERNKWLAERADNLLLTLKHQFPNLPQTTLETTKIQCNKDIGKSILESYSRVLESLAYNIVSRIDDVLSIDKLSSPSDVYPSLSTLSSPTHQTMSSPLFSVPPSSTPSRYAPATPNFSQTPNLSPSKQDIIPFLNRGPPRRSKSTLSTYLCAKP